MLTAARLTAAEGARACFLGVERSVLGKRWESRNADDRQALALSQRFDLPELVGRVLAARGIEVETAEDYLSPTLRKLMPDPGGLMDMPAAVEILLDAIRSEKPIALFGDYDVDGATSAALLTRFLRAVGAEPRIYIPDRQAEGYGPNAPALRRLAAEGIKVVVTLDCGTSAFEALEAGRAAGLEIVVVDHHTAGTALPPVGALVNPNRLDDDMPLGQLAAVGVAFLLVVALNRGLRAAGWYDGASRPEPDLLAWLDLVALGTVCDLVPLDRAQPCPGQPRPEGHGPAPKPRPDGAGRGGRHQRAARHLSRRLRARAAGQCRRPRRRVLARRPALEQPKTRSRRGASPSGSRP